MGRSIDQAKWQQWQQRFQRFAQSNLAISEFCKLEAVSLAAFYQWRRKLQPTKTEPEPAPAMTTGFVPVLLTQRDGIEVRFRNGIVLAIPAGNQEALRQAVILIHQLPMPTVRQETAPC